MGSTYPRDHVKVARGLLSCALPQVEVILAEETSVGEATRVGLTSDGGQDNSKVDGDRQKYSGTVLLRIHQHAKWVMNSPEVC